MARTAEDLSNEVLNLREQNLRYDNKLRETKEQLERATTELAWWRKTFGPEKTL